MRANDSSTLVWFLQFFGRCALLHENLLNRINMKKMLVGLALLTTLSTVSMAGPFFKGKKARAKARAERVEAKKENCEKGTSSCCMKKAQA